MRLYLAALLAPALLASAHAQTALLRAGDPAPDGTPGQAVTFIGGTAANQNGGYACTYVADGPGGRTEGIWGTFTPGTGGALIRQVDTIGPLTQTGIESTFGMNANSVCYAAPSNDLVSGAELNVTWIDDTPIYVEGQALPNTTDVLEYTQRPGITEDGTPYTHGGSVAPGFGGNRRSYVFLGNSAVYSSGDILPDIEGSLSLQGPDPSYRFSALGNHNITLVRGQRQLDRSGGSDHGFGFGIVRRQPVLAAL